MNETYVTPDHELLRKQLNRFITHTMKPGVVAWEETGCGPSEVLRKKRYAGLLG